MSLQTWTDTRNADWNVAVFYARVLVKDLIEQGPEHPWTADDIARLATTLPVLREVAGRTFTEEPAEVG